MINNLETVCRFCEQPLKQVKAHHRRDTTVIYLPLWRCEICRMTLASAPEGFILPSRYSLQLRDKKIIKVHIGLDNFNIDYRTKTDETCISKMLWDSNLNYAKDIEIVRLEGDLFTELPNEQLKTKLQLVLTFL